MFLLHAELKKNTKQLWVVCFTGFSYGNHNFYIWIMGRMCRHTQPISHTNSEVQYLPCPSLSTQVGLQIWDDYFLHQPAISLPSKKEKLTGKKLEEKNLFCEWIYIEKKLVEMYVSPKVSEYLRGGQIPQFKMLFENYLFRFVFNWLFLFMSWMQFSVALAESWLSSLPTSFFSVLQRK